MTRPYDVQLAPLAYQQFKAFGRQEQKTILRLIETLCINPRPEGSRKIEGMTGLYVEAVNHARLVYKIEDQEILVLLIK